MTNTEAWRNIALAEGELDAPHPADRNPKLAIAHALVSIAHSLAELSEWSQQPEEVRRSGHL